jgi:hypothetical protein
VVGKLRNAVDDEIRVSGRGPNGERVNRVFPVRVDARRDGGGRSRHLPHTWAQREIEWLTTSRGHGARDNIVSLSQEYTVLSRYTALLVLENDAMYREFGVQRRTRNKDRWSGKLDNVAAPATGAKIGSKIGGNLGLAKSEAKAKESAHKPTDTTTDEDGNSNMGRGFGRGNSQDNKDAEGRDRGSGGAPAAAAPPMPTSSPAPTVDEPWNDALAKNAQDPAPEAEQGPAEEDFDDDEASTPAGETTRGAARPKAPSKKGKASSKPRPSDGSVVGGSADPLSGLGGGGSGGYWERPKIARPRPQIRVRESRAPSNRTLTRIERYLSNRNHSDRTRSMHRRLVRAAVATGHPQAPEFAAAWAEIDPDHAPALRAHANMLAAKSDGAALRAYASAAEVQPFSVKIHRSLADAFARKGDLARSCSHRLALVSIDPAMGSHHAGFARCLARAGDLDRARRALDDGFARSRKENFTLNELRSALAVGAPLERNVAMFGRADLTATLEWSGNADLDLVVVDSSGNRMSGLWAHKLRVQESPGHEVVSLQRVRKTHHVEVARFDGGQDTVHATLRIRTPGGNRTFPVEISHGTVRVARVSWSR